METQVPGLYLIEDFLSSLEATNLMNEINQQIWIKNRSQTRNVQIYGPKHNQNYEIIPNDITPLPEFLKDLSKKILETTCNKLPQIDLKDYKPYLGIDKYTEIFINEYKPEDKLDQHFDHRGTYKEIIFGLSLECASYLTFTKNSKKVKVKLPERSLYLMTGDSRNVYKHGIESGSLEGDRRVSLTFRTVNY